MIGKTISHYKVTGKLGEGGMGVVYEAYDTVLKRKVALKFLPAGLTSDDESRKRFVREAQAAAALDHPNICTVHEIGEDEGQTFIVMPCVDGYGLADRLKDGPLPVDEALDIAIQVGRGMAKAHKNDIVHRDIKPGNILITEDRHVKIVDFGLAKLGSMSKMTMVGTTMGTAGYMSPEQARGGEVDSRSDIWALGVVLYEMLTGSMPFRGEVDAAVIYSIMNEEPEPVDEACPECPEGLSSIITTALAKETAERFQSMDELVAALEAVHGGDSVPTVKRPAGRSGGRANRRIATGIIVVAVIAAAILGYRFLRRGQTIESIAVLPLIDHSAADNERGIVDGFTGTLITELGKIETVRLTGHRSVMKYRDSEKSLSEIAGELDVDALLEGELVRDGEKVQLTVRLYGIDPERQLWTETFNRKYEDILTMYSEVTCAIAAQIKAAISPAAEAAMANRKEVNPRAYDNYIIGISWLNASIDYEMEGDLGKAKKFFDASLAIDSTYAPAWAGLAEVHIMSSHSSSPPEHAVELALENVEKALALDSTVSDAYRSKGHTLWEHVFDMEGGGKAIERGLELNPSDAYLTLIKSIYLMCTGRLEEGARAGRRASELDPLSFKVNAVTWVPLAAAGRKDEAIEQILKTKETFPDYSRWRAHLSWTYALNGEYDRAIEEIDSLGIKRGDDGWSTVLLDLAILNHLAGRVDKAQELLDEYDTLIDISDFAKRSPWYAAQYFTVRGDHDRAFELLEEEFNTKHWYITRLTIEYRFTALREDPRFMDLARRIGLRE